MSKIDPYDPIDEWADEATWHVCRFNVAYRSWLNGLVQDVSQPELWGGTEEQQEEMRAKMYVLAQQIDTPYEPPVEDELNNIVQIGYIVAAGSQGDAITSQTWEQCPYNTLLGDTTGAADLQGDGSIILPTGGWLLKFVHGIYVPSDTLLQLRVAHAAGQVVYSAEHRGASRIRLVFDCPVVSDGGTPIEIEVWAGQALANGWGASSYNTVAHLHGTATFIEIPT